MQFDLNYHDEIFEVTTSGDAILQGYYDFVKAVLEHKEWKPGGLVLINNTELNTGTLTIDDINALAEISNQYREQIGKAKVAIVLDRDLDYGMARIWQTFVGLRADWQASEKLFRNMVEAEAWLNSTKCDDSTGGC